MESIYTDLALYGSKDESSRTDNVFLPISEVCDGMVSLGFYNSFLFQQYKSFLDPDCGAVEIHNLIHIGISCN